MRLRERHAAHANEAAIDLRALHLALTAWPALRRPVRSLPEDPGVIWAFDNTLRVTCLPSLLCVLRRILADVPHPVSDLKTRTESSQHGCIMQLACAMQVC